MQRVWVGLALVGALLVGLAAAGDREVASFFVEKAQKSYRSRDYDQAEQYYRKALSEHAPFPEASYGLGLVLEKLDRDLEALGAYRSCHAAISSQDKPPRALKTLAGKAARAIKRLQRRFAPLEQVNAGFIQRYVAFGREVASANPDWARKAFETVLLLDPTHPTARSELARLDRKPRHTPKSDAGKRWGQPLIRGDDLDGWSPGRSQHWSCSRGVIRGKVEEPSGQINWLDDLVIAGDYALQVRVRIVGRPGARRTYGFFVGNAKDRWWCVILTNNDELVLELIDQGQRNTVRHTVLSGFDAGAWHTYRLEVEGGDATIYLDDRKAFDFTGERRNDFDGKVGVYVQDATAEFSDLELKR